MTTRMWKEELTESEFSAHFHVQFVIQEVRRCFGAAVDGMCCSLSLRVLSLLRPRELETPSVVLPQLGAPRFESSFAFSRCGLFLVALELCYRPALSVVEL